MKLGLLVAEKIMNRRTNPQNSCFYNYVTIRTRRRMIIIPQAVVKIREVNQVKQGLNYIYSYV